MLAHDDQIVREKAVESFKIVAENVSDDYLLNDIFPILKGMCKGELFAMRISSCFLYVHIYKRLDIPRKLKVRKKFSKLVKDDTPMVRRGAA